MNHRYPQMPPPTIPGTDYPFQVISRTGPPKLLTDKELKQRRGLLAKIHIAKEQMRLNKDEYEMFLRSFGVASAGDIQTIAELERMVKILKSYGWREIKVPHKGASPEQVIALRGRCVAAAREIKNGDKRLAGLAEKICGTSQIVWCQNAKKLERLLAVLGNIKNSEKENEGKVPKN